MRSFAHISLGLGLAIAMSAACSTQPGSTAGGAGGKTGSGGASASGGTSSTGGTQARVGTSGIGGVSATGGSSDAGGKQGTGGSATGSKSGSGGATTQPGTGGSVATGGAPARGTTSRTGGAGGGAAGGVTTPIDSGTGGGNGPVYNPNFVEFYGADCVVPDPKDVSISTLTDLFVSADGSTRIAKKSDWRCQRAYLKKVIEKYIHGSKPGTPDKVTGSVSATSIKVHVEHGGKTADFSASVSMPTGTAGPVPAIIGLGGGSLDSTIVKGEGVAVVNYDNYGISDENSKAGVFTNIYGTTPASSQVAWAWGVSRIIDVLVSERDAGRNNIIDPTGIGVTGCSRLGKGAFTIGAFDERIALGIPQESGTGGVSALRIVNTAPTGPNGKAAEAISGAASVKGWFGTDFATHMSKINTIPGDMHSLAAMYAPRGLLILDNSRIGELCSNCAYGTASAAGKVYEALGIGKNIAYSGGNPTDPQNHCQFYPATQGDPLKRAIRAHLTKKAAPDARMDPQAVTKVDLAKWIPWSAPTLVDDTSWASPPLTSK